MGEKRDRRIRETVAALLLPDEKVELVGRVVPGGANPWLQVLTDTFRHATVQSFVLTDRRLLLLAEGWKGMQSKIDLALPRDALVAARATSLWPFRTMWLRRRPEAPAGAAIPPGWKLRLSFMLRERAKGKRLLLELARAEASRLGAGEDAGEQAAA